MDHGLWTKKLGFSLIELVLIIAVVGLLALAVVVLSPGVSLARLDAAARQVQSDIEYAKQNALLSEVTSGAAFTSGGSYTVYQNTIATPILSPLTRQSMVITLSNNYPGISISTNYTVEFNRFGSPTTGGGGSVTLTDGTNTRTISVTANTGRVTVP